MKLVILPGQRLLVDKEWKVEGDEIDVSDDYRARVLIASEVAAPAPVAEEAAEVQRAKRAGTGKAAKRS